MLTLDNASSNTTKCETIQATHEQRNLPLWSAEQNQLLSVSCQLFDSLPLTHEYSCLGYVVNLVEVDVMTHITKIAAVETATAIWEYDPSLPDNCVLNGSLDVTAAIWTVTIKVGHISLLLSVGSLTCCRFNHLGSKLKHLRSCNLNAAFMTH